MMINAADRTPAVETAGVTKRFGRVLAVDDVSVAIPSGGVYGLLGPNGSGKTTLLSMLAGFLRPNAGEITVLGRTGDAGLRESRAALGTLVDRPVFWPYLSCRDNLKCLQGVYGSAGGDAEIDDLLATVGLLDDAAHRKFRACSTGMKARLGIAGALLGNPSLLILDEPTNGLDPVGIIEVRQIIRNLASNGERTIILASHLLNEVEQVCDQVGVMARGRLLYSGAVSGMGATSRVAVRTTDDQMAVELLRQGGWQVNGESPEAITVDVEPGSEWEITKALANSDVYVAEMRSLVSSLEAGFMEVTGEENPHDD